MFENKGDKRRNMFFYLLLVSKIKPTKGGTCFSNSLENKGDKEEEKSRSARVHK